MSRITKYTIPTKKKIGSVQIFAVCAAQLSQFKFSAPRDARAIILDND